MVQRTGRVRVPLAAQEAENEQANGAVVGNGEVANGENEQPNGPVQENAGDEGIQLNGVVLPNGPGQENAGDEENQLNGVVLPNGPGQENAGDEENLNGVVLPNGVVQFPADQNQFPHPAEAIPLDPMIEEVAVGECSLKKDIDAVKKKIKVNVDSGDCSAQKLKKFRKDLRYLKAAALSESIDQHLE